MGDSEISIELYSKLKDFVEDRMTLAELEDWLAPRLQDFLGMPVGPKGTKDIAYTASTVELCLAEVDCGIRTDQEMKSFLAEHFSLQLETSYIVVTGSSSPYNIAEWGGAA